MNPTITVRPSGDTGGLLDSLPGPQTLAPYVGFTPARVIFFGAGGLFIGHFVKKHGLIGALIGAGYGYYNAQKAIANGAGNPNLPGAVSTK